MVEHKIYLAQDDMQEGDKVFLTRNASGFPATYKVSEYEVERMIKAGRECYTFGGRSVKRGEAVFLNNNTMNNMVEVIACLQ